MAWFHGSYANVLLEFGLENSSHIKIWMSRSDTLMGHGYPVIRRAETFPRLQRNLYLLAQFYACKIDFSKVRLHLSQGKVQIRWYVEQIGWGSCHETLNYRISLISDGSVADHHVHTQHNGGGGVPASPWRRCSGRSNKQRVWPWWGPLAEPGRRPFAKPVGRRSRHPATTTMMIWCQRKSGEREREKKARKLCPNSEKGRGLMGSR